MTLKVILCVQHFCNFGAMLFTVNLLIRMEPTVICVPCMLKHACYEPFSLKYCRFGRYLTIIRLIEDAPYLGIIFETSEET